MDKVFGINRKNKQSVGERLALAQRPAAKPALVPGQRVERQMPPVEEYLNPDHQQGRDRVILMLSEDGTIIEPVIGIGPRMTLAFQASIMVQKGADIAQEIIEIAQQLQRENETLKAEIEFLREQIARGVAPPPPNGVPNPFPDQAVVRGVAEGRA